MKYPRIASAIIDEPWAIQPAKLEAIVEFVHAHGIGADHPKIEAAIRVEPERVGATAVIPIRGTIVQRANMMTEWSGGTSLEMLTKQLRSAVNDPAVDSIVLDIHSHGGSVYGLQEFGDELRAARDQKPVYAVANSMAASAAYHIAAQATEVIAQPSAEVGSIGVIMAHTDWSKWNEGAGLKVTYITAGDYKAEGNPDEPLSDEALSYYQGRVDDYYQSFVDAVAKGRGIDAGVVADLFGQGRMYGANQAKSVGMIDRIDTLENVIAGLQPRSVAARSRARAELNRLQLS